MSASLGCSAHTHAGLGRWKTEIYQQVWSELVAGVGRREIQPLHGLEWLILGFPDFQNSSILSHKRQGRVGGGGFLHNNVAPPRATLWITAGVPFVCLVLLVLLLVLVYQMVLLVLLIPGGVAGVGLTELDFFFCGYTRL